MGKGKYIFAGLLMLATLSGCVSYPISKDLQKQAAPLTLGQVTAGPAAAQGAIVIWGGRIVNTINDTNGGSIYVMDLPLDSDGKPISYSSTDGRFIAASPGFLDPEAYPYGALITVAGQVERVRTETLQNMQYTYPVLTIRQTRVWPVQTENQYNYYPGYGYYSGYHYPGWYGAWWPWYPWWGWYGGVGFFPNGHGAFHRSGGAFHGDEFHGEQFHGDAFHGGEIHGEEFHGGGFHSGGGGGHSGAGPGH